MSLPKTLVVTVPGMIGDADLAPLRTVSDVTYDERASITEDELVALCAGYDFLMLNYDVVPPVGTTRLSDGFYEQPQIQQLRAIAVDITGMDWASPKAAQAKGVVLLNIPHYSTQSVAESVLAEVLLHSRQRHRGYMDQVHGRSPQDRKGINLAGRTAGIIGLGSIGARTSQLLTAVGMNVVAWNRTPRDGAVLVSLEEMFDTAEVISVSVKTVKAGEGMNVRMVSGELLKRCSGSILVNLANEALVDHEAMADAVEAGRVTGYTVEWSDELAAGRLGSLEGVHLAPHNAWYSDESLATLRDTWVSNVVDAIAGRATNVYLD